MRIKYLSDLHLEFEKQTIEDYFDIAESADVVVFAGDICVASCSENLLARLVEYIAPVPLIFVGGNHDYYYGDKVIMNKKFTALESVYDNFHFLNRKSVTIDDVVFVGATGWQDNQFYNYDNFSSINDFRHIKHHNKDVQIFGRRDRAAIIEELDKIKSKQPVIIVTHLSPCAEGILWGTYEVEHKGEYIQAYYNDWENIIDRFEPTAWICGHCHDSIESTRGKTKILRNALGYVGHARCNNEFDKHKTLIV